MLYCTSIDDYDLSTLYEQYQIINTVLYSSANIRRVKQIRTSTVINQSIQ